MLGPELRQLAEDDPTVHVLTPAERNPTATARERTIVLRAGRADNPAVRAMIVAKLGELEERKQGLQAGWRGGSSSNRRRNASGRLKSDAARPLVQLPGRASHGGAS